MTMPVSWMLTLLLPLVFAGGTPINLPGGETVDVDRAVVYEALREDISSDLPNKRDIFWIYFSGRKLLASGSQAQREEISSAPLQKITLAASGMFLLCCAFICPCFRSRFKDPDEQPVLGPDKNSSHLSSSFDSNSNSRNSGTPHRFCLSRESSTGSMHTDMNKILKATNYFSKSHKIGEGKFGTVYKAVLNGGQVVAVKRARKEHFQALRTEFSNEVNLLTKIDHHSLVKIVDYIDQGNERIIITEYVPNGTLREHLDGRRGKILTFGQRLEIAIDIGHGLTYLHTYAEKTIIHRDVKSSNILLTEDLKAKVADFGLARTSLTEEGQTHVSTNVKGTLGYLDPEYALTYQLSPKSDVFSYGALLLEIISGRRPVDPARPPLERLTIKWAFNKFREGKLTEILDPLVEEEVDEDVLRRILGLAFRCEANTRVDRPTMREVVGELWSIRRAYKPVNGSQH